MFAHFKILLKIILFFFQAALIVFITMIDSIRVVFFMSVKKDKGIFYSYARKWSKKLLKISRIKLRVSYSSSISGEKSYIFASNHSSLFDIPIVICAIQNDIKIMYKRELEKIPIFGWCLKNSPYIAVSRTQPKNAMASLEEAQKSMEGNASLLMFAEGTRSKDGKLASFKRGAFVLAARSGKPIVPVAIVGSANIMTRGKLYFRSGIVKVNIFEPLDTSGVSGKADEIKLMNSVHSIVAGALDDS